MFDFYKMLSFSVIIVFWMLSFFGGGIYSKKISGILIFLGLLDFYK